MTTSRKINLLLVGYESGTYTFAIMDERMHMTGEFAYLTGNTMLDTIQSASKTYALAIPTTQRESRRKATGHHLPQGSGGVRCTFCQAHAAAKGDGTPITLKHLSACPEFKQPNRAYAGVRRYLVVVFWEADRVTEDLIIEAPEWDTVRSLVPQILDRDYAPGWSIISVSQTG